METNEILDSNVFDQQINRVTEYTIAGQGKRFANYIIDLIIIYILCFIVGILYVILLETTEMSRLLSYLIALVVNLSYYILIEGTTGKSIGKMITRTKVLNEDYSRPDIGTILKRSLCRVIPLEPFSFLGSGGWHDTISGTIVVED
jgi:uncharacterized RDD family membrane protein YckC